MNKEANLRHKSTKLPVQLYRTFFKIAIAAAVYASFCVFRNSGSEELAASSGSGFVVAVSLFFAIAYELTYLIYKSHSRQALSKDENTTLKQVFTLLRSFGFMVGLWMVVTVSEKIAGGAYLLAPALLVAYALCHQIYNNKFLMSHLSTFCESFALGTVIVTLELIYRILGPEDAAVSIASVPVIAVLVCVTLLLYALAEVFFFFYNIEKHYREQIAKVTQNSTGTEDKKNDRRMRRQIRKQAKQSLKPMSPEKKRALISDRLIEFARNAFLVCTVWVIFALLVISGSVEYALSIGIYAKAVVVIPIIVSIVTPIAEAQKQRTKQEAMFDKYDPRIPPSELSDAFETVFGKGSSSEKALRYVLATMTKERGHKRYNGEDYYVHPIAVAKLLLDHTNEDDDVIAAALLHDCIEDVEGCTFETLSADFGEEIAARVKLLSKTPGKDYHEPENMRGYLDAILKDPKAAIIKVADRINNMNTLENCSDSKKYGKFLQTKRYYPSFVSKARAIDPDNSDFYDFAQKCFEENKY